MPICYFRHWKLPARRQAGALDIWEFPARPAGGVINLQVTNITNFNKGLNGRQIIGLADGPLRAKSTLQIR